MRDIVEASSFKDYLSSSGVHPPFTLLAPTNHAIENSRVSTARLQEIKAKKEDADVFVKRHILPTPLCCSGVGVSSWLFTNRVKTLNENLTYKIRKDSRNRVRIGEAVVQQCDKMASNGIVHIVDQPMVPPRPAWNVFAAPEPVTSDRRRASDLEVLLFGL
ncbi:protein sll1483-like [Frankliniella occidentalis]|uniref:Protein sll1483-like n=1 Tax=Frankliniella occidentalis TaxID=133901 RepID=A0A9C6XBT9_FRAOC|nr:protein sll1483-like [Frankliniella occidentalis]